MTWSSTANAGAAGHVHGPYHAKIVMATPKRAERKPRLIARLDAGRSKLFLSIERRQPFRDGQDAERLELRQHDRASIGREAHRLGQMLRIESRQLPPRRGCIARRVELLNIYPAARA